MLRRMPQRTSAQLDSVFRALGDPTRRAVIEQLATGSKSTSALAQPFSMAFPSFTQHLDVLERCGLVLSHKQGRIRTFRLAPESMTHAESWISTQRDLWDRRLDQLDNHLRTMKDMQP
ncbi:MAG: regulatory protein ArsR [Acidimicrobiaceae bacterium]|nr:MAG: regulatory protein ArsR [Acidimicrobiaceae bacterium]